MSVSEYEADTFRRTLLGWADGNLRDFPWRETTNPYEVLVAEVLLQKTLASKVPPIYEEFLRRYPSPSALGEANVDDIVDLLEPLGFQNQRGKALVDIGDAFADTEVPAAEDELSELRYVGPYATNAVLCFAFDQRRPIVDGNVIRVYNRAFGFDFTAQQNAAWEFAEGMLPTENYQKFNLGLLDFGAMVCVSGEPYCNKCFFNDCCDFWYQDAD